MKKFKIFFSIAALLVLALYGIKEFNSRSEHIEKETRFLMDTFVTISVVGPKSVTSKAIRFAFEAIGDVDVRFNPLNPKSQVYAFNVRGEPITDVEVIGLVTLALQMSQEFDGAFDITVAPLLKLWGFTDKQYRLPLDEEIKHVLRHVGYQHIKVTAQKVEKDNPNTAIDLGGIAKGYALKKAVEVLRANGVKAALVDAGGDVYALGKKGPAHWRVGIRNPRGEDLLGYVEVQDQAVMGSGDYERFFMKDGSRYHHIFNPKTGYPTQGVASVTLLCSDPVKGQILTKIPFVMGIEDGFKRLKKFPGIEVIAVNEEGKQFNSAGIKRVFHLIPAEN